MQHGPIATKRGGSHIARKRTRAALGRIIRVMEQVVTQSIAQIGKKAPQRKKEKG